MNVLGDQGGVNLLCGPVFGNHKQSGSVGGLTRVVYLGEQVGVLSVGGHLFIAPLIRTYEFSKEVAVHMLNRIQSKPITPCCLCICFLVQE